MEWTRRDIARVAAITILMSTILVVAIFRLARRHLVAQSTDCLSPSGPHASAGRSHSDRDGC
jgi:hypothetical protein